MSNDNIGWFWIVLTTAVVLHYLQIILHTNYSHDTAWLLLTKTWHYCSTNNMVDNASDDKMEECIIMDCSTTSTTMNGVTIIENTFMHDE